MLTIEKRFYQFFKSLAVIFIIVTGFGILILLMSTIYDLLSNQLDSIKTKALMWYAISFELTFCFYKYMYYKQRYFELKASVENQGK